ncbi:MAG: hypothetical protein GX800_01780, partial [Clostridiaceae bacterium]|nr:hypothetical protein [Clostridiaceae bacterium]
MVSTIAKRIIKALNIRWIPVFFISFILSLGYMSYNFLASYNKLTMVMSLNYPNAEKGLYPDGTRFNIFRIKSEQVLDRAISNFSENGITVDRLRNRIDVYEKASNKDVEEVKTAKLSGRDYKYIPNEYTISYSQKNKFAKNHTYEMLSAIAVAYDEIFRKEHADNNSVLKFDAASFADYDIYEYIEIADLLFDKANMVASHISMRNTQSGGFISKETGETFANIDTMVRNFKDIEIEKFKAFIISSAIAKDRASYINKLRYKNDNLSFEKRKALIELDFTKGALEKYDPNMTGVAFIPTLDKTNEFYMSRTKIGIDYLANAAYKAGITAEKAEKEIEANNYLINMFSNINHDELEESRLKSAAEKMLTNLKDDLSVILSVALKTDNEYILYETRDYLKFNIPEKSI